MRWHYRLRLPDNDASDAAVHARRPPPRSAQLPDAGWEIRTRTNASPALERNVERFTQYLTLVGLTALLVGGVGVANAVKGHLDRKRDVIATLKSLGATGGARVRDLSHAGDGCWPLIGALPGLALGAALPFLIAWGFGAVLPLPLAPALHPGDLALALLYGLLTALAFALWPLGRAHDVPVSALFRDEVAPRAALAAPALCGGDRAGRPRAGDRSRSQLAYDRRIAAIFVGGGRRRVRAAAAGRRAADGGRAARCRGRARPSLRLAIANIHRPGALTPSVVLSLGLGLALLVTVIEIDGNLRRQFIAALPDKAPSFYLRRHPVRRRRALRRLHPRSTRRGATLDRVPMLRGRIVAANGVPAEDIKPPPDAAWVLQSDRGITYSRRPSRPARAWSPANGGRPTIRAAAGLVRAAHRRRARPQGRRHRRRSTCSAATSTATRRQSAHARLAEPRHQFRDGVLARRAFAARRTPTSPR